MILICIILIFPVASAEPLSDILDRKYLDFAHALNYFGVYFPDKNIQNSDHIIGWIDIVGYDNMTCKDGVYYVPGIPVNHTIVKYEIWDTGLYWNNNLDYIEIIDKRIFQDEDNVTTEIDIHLLWHHSKKRKPPGKGIKKTYHHEYATFSDTETAPDVFLLSDNSNVSVDVVIYNNTVSPKTSVKVFNVPANTLSINYTYDNESIIHHKGIAIQEYTDKNCPYMQINSTDIWEDNGNLSHFNKFAIIPSMNYSTDNLTVTVNNPYEAHIVDNITIYEVRWHGMKDTFSSLLLPFVAIIGIFILGVVVQLRRI